MPNARAALPSQMREPDEQGAACKPLLMSGYT